MLAYLLSAAIFLTVYYFVEQKILKNSLLKAGRSFSEISDSTNLIRNDNKTLYRKKTDYYRLQNENMVFISIECDKPDLAILDLDYKGLVRFKQLIEKYENNERPDYEFFEHKKHKHLIFPFISDKHTIEIILLSTYNNTINDVFNRNPRRG